MGRANMNVLITGGAGFIGSHLVEHLLAAGNTVRVLDNLSTGKRENLPGHSRLEFVPGDIRDRDLVFESHPRGRRMPPTSWPGNTICVFTTRSSGLRRPHSGFSTSSDRARTRLHPI